MDDVVNVSESGGVAVVVLARDFQIPEDYRYHPQIVPLDAADLPTDWGQLTAKIPTTTKIVLVGGELPAPLFGSLRTVLTRRSLLFVQRRNTAALHDALRRILPEKKAEPDVDHHRHNGNGSGPPTSEPAAATIDEPRTRGHVAAFVAAEADLAKGSAEEARRLMRLAQQRGITTTVASLAQAISKAKRQGGRTDTPRSLMSAQQRALVTLDEAIGTLDATKAGLQLVREYVAETEALNVELQKKIAAFRKIVLEQ